MLKFFLLLGLVSCGTFRPSLLHTFSNEQKVSLVRPLGEGRGRLSVQQHHYLFDIDALWKDQSWIFVATIPMHGEEVLELSDLKNKDWKIDRSGTFEKRLFEALNDMYPNKNYDKLFMEELRKFLRLIQAKELGLARACVEKACTVDGEEFQVLTHKQSFTISRQNSQGFTMSITGEDPSEEKFGKLTYKILSPMELELVKLEFFWST